MVTGDDVIVVTTDEVPGHQVTAVFGEVFGLVVRARDAFAQLAATFRSMAGGEVVGYTRLLAQSRDAAMTRLRAEAARVGANAVVAARVGSGEVTLAGNAVLNEFTAYGTAVWVEPLVPDRGVELYPPRRLHRPPSLALPGQAACVNVGCEAQGLPTTLARCDLCGAETVAT